MCPLRGNLSIGTSEDDRAGQGLGRVASRTRTGHSFRYWKPASDRPYQNPQQLLDQSAHLRQKKITYSKREHSEAKQMSGVRVQSHSEVSAKKLLSQEFGTLKKENLGETEISRKYVDSIRELERNHKNIQSDSPVLECKKEREREI